MSEPLTREELGRIEMRVMSVGCTVHTVRLLLNHGEALLDRVAELEKEQEAAWPEYVARAQRAEAGLSAAQEALKKGREFERAYQESRGATWTPPMQERLDSLQSAFIDSDVAALARGGGQQDTG